MASPVETRKNFAGFPRRSRLTAVPSILLGALLEEIDDIAELKCTLRLLWMLQNGRGFPRCVTDAEITSDRVLLKGLGGPGRDAAAEVRKGLDLAVRRGTVLTGLLPRDGGTARVYAINSESERRAFDEMTSPAASDAAPADPEGAPEIDRPNIFGLYENNIGMLNPIIAEELKRAEETYPEEWIRDAFREAVTRNRRSWRYIAVILDRWDREGKDDGRPVGSFEKAGYERYLGR